MSKFENFCQMLTGGHPNSLGKTDDVAEIVIRSPERIVELYKAYDSDDEVVRLRVSSAFKRVFLAEPEWFKKWYSKFSKRVLKLKQPSALWTYALLCLKLESQLTPKNREHATESLKEVLLTCEDWIVLNNTIETLGAWASNDSKLKKWLKPKLRNLSKDPRKSVAKRAAKTLDSLSE